MLSNGTFTTIDFPDARPRILVLDINDQGQLAGAYDLLVHGYLRDERGEFTIIDVPNVVTETAAFSINNRGQIVGSFDGEMAGNFSDFLRDKDGRFSPIDIPRGCGYSRRFDQRARTDRGQLQRDHPGYASRER
jgi:hypothetical protein